MKTRLLVLLLLAGGFLFTGCKTGKDLLSWSPFWWVVNMRRVEHPGGLRTQLPVVSTRNYSDDKKQYSYMIDSGIIMVRIGEDAHGTWRPLPGGNPRDCNGERLSVLRLAADNNRIFIMARNSAGKRSLWRYCTINDGAVWSSVLIHAGGDFMKKGYAEWFDCAHTRDSSWVNVLALRTFVPYKEPRLQKVKKNDGTTDYRVVAYNAPRMSIDVDDIVDIAVGSWGGTVINYYLLMGSTGKIMYIDEEIIMDRWKEVPNLHGTPKNSPYPLDSTARIAASNSVVAVYHQKNDSAFVTWIRWDYHNYQDFEFFPINWCETEWRKIACPVKHAQHLKINTHWPSEVSDTIWHIPPSIEKQVESIKKILPDAIGKKMRKEDWRGCFSSYPQQNVSRYYCAFDVVKGDTLCSLRQENERYPAFTAADWNVTVEPKGELAP